MNVVISPDGNVTLVYDEAVRLDSLGALQMRRASHVEPDGSGWWWADLSPMGGPRLGPFAVRSAALSAETAWLARNLATVANSANSANPANQPNRANRGSDSHSPFLPDAPG